MIEENGGEDEEKDEGIKSAWSDSDSDYGDEKEEGNGSYIFLRKW